MMRWGVEGEYSQDLFESLPSSEEKKLFRIFGPQLI